jgi:hypothetical protein
VVGKGRGGRGVVKVALLLILIVIFKVEKGGRAHCLLIWMLAFDADVDVAYSLLAIGNWQW